MNKEKKKKKNLLKELKHYIHFQVYGFILGNYGIRFKCFNAQKTHHF